MKKEPVYIIIPVHNRKNVTLDCLKNLRQHGYLKRYHLIVIDDGSTDGTTPAVNQLYPDVLTLSGDGNLWWTGAIKKGMEFAYQQGAEYFIWLNDDCIPDANSLSLLVKFLQTHINTIVGMACYSTELNLLIENGFKGRKRFTANPGEVVFVDGLSGYCVGIPASVYTKIGSPDAKKYPHYWGDTVYLLKATRSGFKACILGEARVVIPEAIDSLLNFSGYLGSIATTKFRFVFFNKKSRYYLPAQYFHALEKYSLLIGLPLFFTKLIYWFIQYIYFKLKLTLSLNL